METDRTRGAGGKPQAGSAPSPEEEEVAAFLAEQQGDGEGKEEGEQPRPPALPIEESLAKLRAMRGIASCPYRPAASTRAWKCHTYFRSS